MKCIILFLGIFGVSESFTIPNHSLKHDIHLSSSSTQMQIDNHGLMSNDDTEEFMKDQDVQPRRDFLKTSMAILGSTSAAMIPNIAGAEDDKFTLFQDENSGFQIKVPQGWQQSEQNLPDRRRIVLFVNDDGSTDKDLMFVAFTPVRDDFTSLGSMGSLDQVGQMTILPKGALMGQESDNKMLSSESKKNAYFYDYVSKSPGQPKRHFRTIFSLAQGATGGAGAVLVTITAQTTDDRYEGLKSTFDEIIDSYGKFKK